MLQCACAVIGLHRVFEYRFRLLCLYGLLLFLKRVFRALVSAFDLWACWNRICFQGTLAWLQTHSCVRPSSGQIRLIKVFLSRQSLSCLNSRVFVWVFFRSCSSGRRRSVSFRNLSNTSCLTASCARQIETETYFESLQQILHILLHIVAPGVG